MRSPFPILATVALSTALASSSVAAQNDPGSSRAHPTRDYPGAAAVRELDDAVERAWIVTREEQPRSELTAALRRMMRLVAHLELRNAREEPMERFQRQYLQAHRAILAQDDATSEPVLHAWSELTAAWRTVRQRVPLGGQTAYYELEGSFGNEPVYFTGRTIEALHEDCGRFLARADVERPQRITIRGDQVFPRDVPFTPAQLCGIAALNAEAVGFVSRPLVSGSVEGVPFVLNAPPEAARATLHRYMPDVVTPMREIDALTIAGHRYRARAAWSPRDVIRMIELQIPEPRGDRLSTYER